MELNGIEPNIRKISKTKTERLHVTRKSVQRINLLLAFASTVFIGFGTLRDTLTYYSSFQEDLFVLQWGLLFD
jgi:hypothetical protein